MESTCTAASCIRPHVRMMRAVGFCRLAPGAASLPRRVHAVYHAFNLSVTSTYVLQQLIYAYQYMDDMEKLSRVLFVLLCHVTCVAKQMVFYFDAARVDRLQTTLDEARFNGGGAVANQAREATAKGAARLLAAYSGCAEATCVLWTALAVASRARYSEVELPFWIGFKYDHPLLFTVVACYSFYATSLVAVGNTTMDAFIATIFDQCKTQLTIVRDRFETLTQRAKTTAEQSGRDYDVVLHETFVDSFIHYQKITECCELLEQIFGGALLVQFGVGGWILCMAAYKIVSLDVLSLEFASTTLFITCILTELLLYCYYGNEVTVEVTSFLLNLGSDRGEQHAVIMAILMLQSAQVAGSLYSARWTKMSVLARRDLLLAMTRAQRPIQPAAGHVVPLTLETYVTILKSSYSFYAVLRQTK